jgi:hypothetical protein
VAKKPTKAAALRKARRARRSFKEQAVRAREVTPVRMPPWPPFWVIGALIVLAGVGALLWMT